jgi:predicted DNA-binding transcriptional regulator AlpA
METSARIIRPREVSRRTGLSLTTIWRLGQRGDFPEKVLLNADGSAVGFHESEIDGWIRRRIRGSGRQVGRPTVLPDQDASERELVRGGQKQPQSTTRERCPGQEARPRGQQAKKRSRASKENS